MEKTILVDAINTFVISGEGIFDPMYSLLESYPHKKIILTNADDEQMKKYGLDSMPYEIFSLKHNPDKINPEYYHTMLNKFGFAIRDVVYFEHNKDAVASAKLVWITTFHYDKNTKDLLSLKRFLDEHLL